MTLEEFLQQKTNEAAKLICAEAPADSCDWCGECEGQLIYENGQFQYECRKCAVRWAPQLRLTTEGRFLQLELAD